MLKDYKIDNLETNEILEKINRENIYNDFIASQEKGFMRFIDYINSTICTLKQKAKISPFIELRARIKDSESALRNFDIDKMLDDVFGIEIICAKEDEIKIIKDELEKVFFSTRTKKHEKPNGYKAIHECYSAQKQPVEKEDMWELSADDVPAVECQFKTIEVELNPEASHYDYKKIDKTKTQEILNNTTLKVGKEIPRMWISRENKIHELNYEEIIQKIYPFIDITTIKILESKQDAKEKGID